MARIALRFPLWDYKWYLVIDVIFIALFENDVSRIRGKGEGYTKLVIKNDKGGRGYMRTATSPPPKNVQIFVFHLILISGQQLSFVYHFGGSVISSIGLSPRQQAR